MPTKATTPKHWQARFLESLGKTAHVGASCRAAGIDRTTAYRLRTKDPRFAEEWDDCLENEFDDVQVAMLQSAKSGDTRAGIFILERRRRSEYGASIEVTGRGGGPIELRAVTIDEHRAALAQALLEAHS